MSKLYDVQLKSLSEFSESVVVNPQRRHNNMRPSPSQPRSDWFLRIDALLNQLVEGEDGSSQLHAKRNSSAHIIRHQSGTSSLDHKQKNDLRTQRSRSTLSGYATHAVSQDAVVRTETVLFDAHAINNRGVDQATPSQDATRLSPYVLDAQAQVKQLDRADTASNNQSLLDESEQTEQEVQERLSQLDRLAESFAPDALDEVFREPSHTHAYDIEKVGDYSAELDFASQEDIHMVEEQSVEEMAQTLVDETNQDITPHASLQSDTPDLFIEHIDEADIEQELDGIDLEEIV